MVIKVKEISEFKAKIFNSTLIGYKSLRIEFKKEDLEKLQGLMEKIGITTKEQRCDF